MDIQIILFFIILGIAVLLFITEFLPIDKISFLIIVALVVTRLTTAEEAVSGFSNPAVITILMLMIIAIALEDNGVIKLLSDSIKRLSFLPLIIIVPLFMIISASISAFISTTAVVIIFLKLITQLSEKYNFSSSKLLMPISFAGILGGSCTLMGTSTNLLVNSIAANLGVVKFSFFEFSMYGLVFLVIGIVFMTVASQFLPNTESDKLLNLEETSHFLFSVRVREQSKYVGKSFSEVPFYKNSNILTLKLIRDDNVNNAPGKNTTLRANDQLIVLSNLDDFYLIPNEDFALSVEETQIVDKSKKSNVKQKYTYVELFILPGSEYLGKSLEEMKVLLNKIAIPIGIQTKAVIDLNEHLSLAKSFQNLNIKAGDRLLVRTNKTDLKLLQKIDNIVVMRKQESPFQFERKKQILSILTLLLVIGIAASGILSILASTIIGVGFLLISNCTNLGKVYKRVNWQIIFLLAGMIPIGVAMINSGTDVWLSTLLIKLLHDQQSIVVLGSVFALTILISGFISNNATAIIITPIAISLSISLNLPVKPFLLAVLFGANFSFFTPMGYQTNTLIYATGVYKFTHFLVIGGILTVLLFVAGVYMLSIMLANT